MVRHPLTMRSESLKTKVFINQNYPFSFTQKNWNLKKRNLKIPRELSYTSTSAFTMHSMSRILQQIKIRIPHRGPFLKKLKKQWNWDQRQIGKKLCKPVTIWHLYTHMNSLLLQLIILYIICIDRLTLDREAD